jgi:hypothetical protein
MTRAGKILVFVNLIFCVFLAAWSVANYAGRTQWADPEKKIGELYTANAELTDAWKGYPAGVKRWATARDDVVVRETGKSADPAKSKQFAGRTQDRLWFENELRLLRSTATKDSPSRQVARDAGGQIRLDPANFNRPAMDVAKERKGDNLQSLRYYTEEDVKILAKTYAELLKLVGDNTQVPPVVGLIDQDIALTERMNGPKGLKQRLEDERTKFKAAELELSLLEPILVNAAVGSQTIVDRSEELQRRIQELNRPRDGDK